SAKLVDRIQAGRSPFGVVFAGDGRVLAVTGGDEDGEINLFDSESLKPLRSEPIGIAPVGVVAEPGGKSVLVALAGADQVVRVGVDDGKIKHTFKVPRAPDRIAVSPDGKSLLITHAGVRADTVTQLDLHHGKTDKVHAGRLPSAVAWTRRGRRLIALGGAGQVVELRKGGGRRKHAVKGSPRALAVAGEKAWVVDGLTGKIERVG
ncbi:MAG: Lactonase, 7-bladed beta-propeller, partial [Thermoleophilaceae bacterium]|nr:Lactonase, 7-bladed beta-propeller [Thermoleophilaceae bacterium]